MNTNFPSAAESAASFEVRYLPLSRTGHALCFPCDPSGHVDLNALSSRALSDYLFARAMVGREYGLPVFGCVY
jgi:hypothetical protein